jgi:dihydroorotate dehydrogenase
VELAKMQEDIGCELIELDFGCPNVTASAYSDLALDGAELGANPQASAEITHRVVRALSIPVYCKLTSEGCNPVTVARACQAAGAHGMVVLNRTPALDIDVETGRPLLGGGYAGVGGPWMLPIMLNHIRTFPELLRIRKENIWAEVREADCTGCGLCPHWCYYDAISLEAEKGQRWTGTSAMAAASAWSSARPTPST